jgi:MFS family permease
MEEEVSLLRGGFTEWKPGAQGRWYIVVLLCLGFFLDSASSAALASSFRALEVEIGLSPMKQGAVLMMQNLTGSLFAPLWGYKADRSDRLQVLAMAAGIWSVSTAVTAHAGMHGFVALIFARILYGVGTSGVTPVVQSIIADMFPDEERGRAFAFCIAASCLGMLVSTVVVTGVSMHDVNTTYQGWQIAFLVLGGAAALFSVALVLLARNLPIPRAEGLAGSAWDDFVETFKMPTFRVVLLQGAFVCTALEAHAFLVIWAQYIGYQNWVAGILVSMGMLGTLVGCFVGGSLGDWAAHKSPDHGRIYVGQVGGSLMLTFWIGIMVVPHKTRYVYILGLLLFLFGSVKNWEYVGAIRPILVEVAPSRRRGQTIGYAAAVDGIVSASLGGPLIGLLAEQVFGYEQTSLDVNVMPEEQRLGNLGALTRALGVVTAACITGNLIAFSILHYTYAADRSAAKLRDH